MSIQQIVRHFGANKLDVAAWLATADLLVTQHKKHGDDIEVYKQMCKMQNLSDFPVPADDATWKVLEGVSNRMDPEKVRLMCLLESKGMLDDAMVGKIMDAPAAKPTAKRAASEMDPTGRASRKQRRKVIPDSDESDLVSMASPAAAASSKSPEPAELGVNGSDAGHDDAATLQSSPAATPEMVVSDEDDVIIVQKGKVYRVPCNVDDEDRPKSDPVGYVIVIEPNATKGNHRVRWLYTPEMLHEELGLTLTTAFKNTAGIVKSRGTIPLFESNYITLIPADVEFSPIPMVGRGYSPSIKRRHNVCILGKIVGRRIVEHDHDNQLLDKLLTFAAGKFKSVFRNGTNCTLEVRPHYEALVGKCDLCGTVQPLKYKLQFQKKQKWHKCGPDCARKVSAAVRYARAPFSTEALTHAESVCAAKPVSSK